MVTGNFLRRFALTAAVLGIYTAAVSIRTSLAAEKPAAEKTAQKPAEASVKNKYLRVVRDAKDRTVGLETAIVSFVPAKPSGSAKIPGNSGKPAGGDVQVDLIAAVHIADKGYYQELNKRFAGYDAVLYELVAPEGTRVPKGGRKGKQRAGNLLSAVQLGMKDMLELEFQLDQVDYTKTNLVHADMSPDQFAKSMKDRNESWTDVFTRLLAYGIAKQAKGGDDTDMQLLMAFFEKDRSLALKRAMAEQFQEMEGATAAFEGPKGSTLIGERNKRALEVLKKQLAGGKKKIAIFYGAGHMADMEKRLGTEFGLKPKGTVWLQAWNMKPAAK